MEVFLLDITPTIMGIHFFACLFLTRIYRSFSRYFHTFINGQIIQVDIIAFEFSILGGKEKSFFRFHVVEILNCTE